MSDIDPAWLRQAFEQSAAKMAELSVYSDHATRDSLNLLLVSVADDLEARAVAVAAAKRRGWKSAAVELHTAAGHVGAYADAMRHFDPDASPAAPALPADDAPRCASFRRATPDDEALCTRTRGHDGDHATESIDNGPRTWPRKHSGAVCGDVLTGTGLPEPLNCELPLGHHGDDHWSDGVTWPRGTNPRAWARDTARPDVDYPGKPGPEAEASTHTFTPDESSTAPAMTLVEHPTTEPADTVAGTDDGGVLYPGMCGDWQTDDDGYRDPDHSDQCMLPEGHTGKHIGHTGARWGRSTPGVADIPAPRAAAPAETMTAQLAQEVGTAVATLERPTGDECACPTDQRVYCHASPCRGGSGLPPAGMLALGSLFAPVVQTIGIGPGPALGIVSAAPAAAKAPLTAPGEPRERLSVSAINAMEDCGLKYRFTYRDQLPQTPAWWNVGGTALHKTIEEIERDAAGALDIENGGGLAAVDFWASGNLLDQQKAAEGMFTRLFEQETDRQETASGVAKRSWRAADKSREDGAWWLSNGGDMARAYVAQRQAWLEDWQLVRTLGGPTAQELEFTHVFGDVALKGFIDDLWQNRSDPRRVMVRDTKAGKRPPESDFQLEVYGEVVRSLPTPLAFEQDLIIHGTYYLARKGEHTAPVELGGNREMVTYRAQMVARADQAGIFMPRPSSFCNSCPFKSKCPAVK